MASTVPTGLFFGFTYAQLSALLTQYTAAVTGALYSGPMTGASINGQSVQFAGREMRLEEYSAELQAALAYLRPDQFDAPPGDRAAFSLNAAACCPRRW